MLDAYFSIKPAAQRGGLREQVGRPAKKKGRAKHPPVVEPYDSSVVHAQFNPSSGARAEPRGAAEDCLVDCEPLGELAVEAEDQYEYLMQEADASQQCNDDDTDSCVTFDDAVSDTAEQYGSSPVADSCFEPCMPRLKAKTSEVPVYSGPELWFEDDDFIE